MTLNMNRTYYPYAVVVAIVATMCFASCRHETETVVNNEPDPPVWTFNSDEVELGTTDFDTFDIERDYSEFKERVYTDPSKKMYVENSEFKDVINIT